MAATDYDVVIAGGGAAGVAAARRLHEAGVNYLLVETRERLGGRAWSVTDPQGHATDLGCGWLHSADRNPWTEIAAAQGHRIDRTPPPWSRHALPLNFPQAEQDEFFEALERYFTRIREHGAKPDAAAVALLDPGGRWNGLIGAVSTYISGATPERLSVHDLASYDDNSVNWRIVQGYGSTVAAHGAGLAVALGCAVTAIDHSGRRLRIETAKGALAADQAIVTLPTALLAADALRFTPALPDKVQAAAGLPLGLADKLYLSLAQPEEFEPEVQIFGRTDRAATGAYNLRPFGRPQIEAYFGGALAADLEAGGPSAFVEFALSELTGQFGSDFAKRVAPLALHRWGSDPYAGGSYSYAVPGEAGSRARLAAPVDNRLFFAGEACSQRDYSTAHGAYRTGVAAAEAVLAARAA